MIKFIRGAIFVTIIALLVMAYFSSDYSKEGPYDINSLLSQMQDSVNERMPALSDEMKELAAQIQEKLKNTDQGEVNALTPEAVDGVLSSAKDVIGGVTATSDAPETGGFDPLEILIKKLQEQDAGDLADRVRVIYKQMQKNEAQPVPADAQEGE
ncbi:MAG: hypothetical protein RBU29_00445 [bacterium]|jgi:hypothetical protein|nr:hypothetical protein [bacterium]